MKIQIKNRFTGAIILDTDAESIGLAIEAAVKIGANLRGANLRGANLRGANLRGADLCGADLCGADLRGADLRDANLRDADLCDADLRGADLCYADLRGAKMNKNELELLLSLRSILPEGDLIGWKKLQGGVICKLKIPASAQRIGGLIGRKCRAEFAVVLDGEGVSARNDLEYKIGEMVKPDKYDPNPLVECSHGIHFFITRQEAEDYSV